LFLRWSLGFSLFLELLLAPPMLQGSHFLLLVHLSRTKSELWGLFYHIEGVQKMWRRAGNGTPSVFARLTKSAEAIPGTTGTMNRLKCQNPNDNLPISSGILGKAGTILKFKDKNSKLQIKVQN